MMMAKTGGLKNDRRNRLSISLAKGAVIALAAVVSLGSESSLRAQSSTGKSSEAQATKKALTEAEKAERELKRREERGASVNPYKAGRTMTMSRNGIVASSHVLASLAGVDQLRAGGTAMDAGIAAAATLAVVEPMMTGMGGDIFILYYEAATGKVHALNGSGRSPRGLTRDHFGKRRRIDFSGWEPVTVPGAVDGWSVAHERFGKRPWAELLAPAIRHAEEGFAVTETVSSIWGGIANADKWAKEAFTIDGKAPKPGQVLKNPMMAKALRLIADGGRDAFYKGPIAREIVRWSNESGGFFAMEDFERHTSDWVEPIGVNYRGYDVYQCPPNSQGIGALIMLNILEGFKVKTMKHNSAEYLHHLVEAKKLAYADLGEYVADPAAANLPVAGMLSKDYAAERRKLIDADTAMAAADPGLPAGTDTIYLSAIDKWGNAVSLVNSQYNAWGSRVGAGNMGFTLQNRGFGFSLKKGHRNEYAPGKRPFHTLLAGMILKDGKLYMSYGLMGGDMQPQGHTQFLMSHLDFGMTIQEANDAPRWRHTGDTLYLEYGMSRETAAELKSMGHKVILGGAPAGGYGGAQAVMVDPKTGSYFGSSDPRKDGAAIGY